MQLRDDHLWELYSSGTIEYNEMIENGRNPDELEAKAREASSMLGSRDDAETLDRPGDRASAQS